jgi:hypothetical protein
MRGLDWKSKFDETKNQWDAIKDSSESQLKLIKDNPALACRIYDRFKDLGFGRRFYEEYKGNKDYQSCVSQIEIDMEEPILGLMGSEKRVKGQGGTGVASHLRTEKERKRYSHLFIDKDGNFGDE